MRTGIRTRCTLALTLAAMTTGRPPEAADPQGSVASKPEAVTTDGVPEIPASTFEELQRYQDIRSASFADWLPSGGIVFSSRIGNVTQLYRSLTPHAVPEEVTSGEEPVAGGSCLPDGAVLFSRGKGGDENFQIYRLDPGSRNPVLLTDGKSRNLSGPLDELKSRLTFTSTIRNGKDADVYILDLARGAKGELVKKVDGETWSIEDWSTGCTRAILSRFVSANETYGYVLDLATRREVTLPDEPPLASGTKPRTVRRGSFRFGPKADSVYLTSDARGEFRELARVDLATGVWAWLTGDLPWDVEDVERSPDGKQLAFTLNADGASRVFLIDVASVERDGEAAVPLARRELQLPAGIVSNLKFRGDSKALGLTWGGASSPSEAYSYELDSSRLVRWTFSERSGFGDGDFIAPQSFRFVSFDGREVPAFIYRPRSAGRAPVIINIHGGPESQARPSFNARAQHAVRELGAAVIFPNVRGSTGYGKTYSLLDNATLREDSVRDIGALLDWIAADPALDSSRVAVLGGSYGGYMVLASLVHFPDRIRAGVDIVGISNFRTFLERTSAYRRDLRRAEYGDERPAEMQQFFERISPASRIHQIRSALLLGHGANDPRVPLSEARQIVEKARSAGVPVWTFYASDEGHGFARRKNADYFDAVTATFFRAHLLGASSPPRTAGTAPESSAALDALDKAIALQPTDGALHHLRAIERFKLRRFRESVADFDRAVELGGRTHSADECWERGLARYYAGDFAGARRQFEGYHRVGPLDIENGLWVFLCAVAEAKGGPDAAAKARAVLPQYGQRVRPPFPALLDLYLGKGSVEAVLQDAAKATGDEGRERTFYAHLYAGKYLQVSGDREAALDHFRKAVAAPVDHFMLWCAKVELAP